MRKIKVFLGEPYHFNNITELEGKFIITAEGADGEIRAFLDEDARAVFPTRESAEKWWDTKLTDYEGKELCVW